MAVACSCCSEPSTGWATGATDVPGLIRGVRLVVPGVAALSAAAGWALGHPLPLLVALVIAGIDVVETSFLLIVVGPVRPPPLSCPPLSRERGQSVLQTSPSFGTVSASR